MFTLSFKASNPLPHPLASHDSLLTLKMCLFNEQVSCVRVELSNGFKMNKGSASCRVRHLLVTVT